MIWTIAIILLLLWFFGAFVFHILGGLIHVVLVIAIGVVLFRLLTRKKTL